MSIITIIITTIMQITKHRRMLTQGSSSGYFGGLRHDDIMLIIPD